jgi:hypothetical protein
MGDPDRVASSLEEAGHRVRVVDLTAAGANARIIREAQLSKATGFGASLVTSPSHGSGWCVAPDSCTSERAG